MIYCVDLYQNRRALDVPGGVRDVTTAIEGQLRRTSLVPVISDFLFPDADRVMRELALLNAVHDVFLLMADVALRLRAAAPSRTAGWRPSTWRPAGRGCCRGASCRSWPGAWREWQDGVARQARDAGLDVVRVGLDRWEMETALVEFTAERRLRKTK